VNGNHGHCCEAARDLDTPDFQVLPAQIMFRFVSKGKLAHSGGAAMGGAASSLEFRGLLQICCNPAQSARVAIPAITRRKYSRGYWAAASVVAGRMCLCQRSIVHVHRQQPDVDRDFGNTVDHRLCGWQRIRRVSGRSYNRLDVRGSLWRLA
jgi:hypothetical protein